MPENSVTAIVTDPPYGLKFMGKEWDSFGNDLHKFQEWCRQWAVECLRVIKPGGYMLVFGGTRTYHRLACGIEDGGWTIKNTLCWVFGAGFPKSQAIDKAIDKKLGTGAGKEFEGYGTDVKPAHEPILLCVKPVDGTYAENALKHGLAGLNVDGCRIGTNAGWSYPNEPGGIYSHEYQKQSKQAQDWNKFFTKKDNVASESNKGRWPANFVMTHHPECVLVGTKKVRNANGSVSGDEPSAKTDQVLGQFSERKAFTKKGDADGFETVEEWCCHPQCPVRLLNEQSGVREPGSSNNYAPIGIGTVLKSNEIA